MTALMAAIFLAVLFLHTFRVEWPMLTAILFTFVELLLVTAVAILFSTFSTPILSSIFALSFYLIGHLSWSLETLIKKMRPGAGRTLARVLYTVLPDLENFNFRTESSTASHPAAHLLYSTAYGLCYTAFILGWPSGLQEAGFI